MKGVIKYIWFVVFLQLFQVLFLKNLELGTVNWWITPFVYGLFLLELPVQFNPVYLLLLGLLSGLGIDLFYDTIGLHASSCLAMTFVRFYSLKIIVPRDGFDASARPSINTLGYSKYIFYISICLFVYHAWFFTIEVFGFQDVIYRFVQTLSSTFAAIFIAIVLHLIFNPKKK